MLFTINSFKNNPKIIIKIKNFIKSCDFIKNYEIYLINNPDEKEIKL